MTSRLDDRTNDFIPATLNYNPDASTFWANYNAFIKLQNVIAQGSGQTWNTVAIPIARSKRNGKRNGFNYAIFVYMIVTLATCLFWLVKLQQKKMVVIREIDVTNPNSPTFFYPNLIKRYCKKFTLYFN